jgi:hypothetical protein
VAGGQASGGRARRRRVGLALVAVALVIAASGCKAKVTKEVLFVNDSVTNDAVGQIVSTFNLVKQDDTTGRYAPNFGSSVPGIGLLQVPGLTSDEVRTYWTDHLTSLVDHVKPEVMVVELGYNDCGFDLSDYGTDIDDFMRLVPPETPVHWLTMADPLDVKDCDETINAALTDATSRWPNLTVFDYAAHMNAHPEWFVDDAHLDADGQHEYAIWLQAQLDALYESG